MPIEMKKPMSDDASSEEPSFLTPIAEKNAELDQSFENILQPWIVQITDSEASYVRPLWQHPSPSQPNPDQSWIAFGITSIDGDYSTTQRIDEDENTWLTYHETIELLVCFYGQDCQAQATRFKLGIYIEQNRDYLLQHGIGIQDIGPLIRAPDFINNRWRNRTDIHITLRRKSWRKYKIKPVVYNTEAPLSIKTR